MQITNKPPQWPLIECRCEFGHHLNLATHKHIFLSDKIVCFLFSWFIFIIIEFCFIVVIVMVSYTDHGTPADRFLIISSCTLFTLLNFYLLYHKWKEM